MIEISQTNEIDGLRRFLPVLGKPARRVHPIPRVIVKRRIKRFQKEDLARAALHDGLILAWDTGLGKALPEDSMVMTPMGYRQMKTLRVGDLVMGANGKPTKITGVFPQGERDVYTVTFTDGTTADCDLDHLWPVRTKVGKYKGQDFKPRTLREIMRAGLRAQAGCRFFIPMVEPIRFEDQSVPLDPYLLGYLLGNGGMSRVHDSPTISIPDQETVDRLASLLPEGNELVYAGGYDYRIRGTAPRNNPSLNKLRQLHLMGCWSEMRFVPDIYKWGSVAQRTAVLQGLLDSDGHVSPKGGHIEYCTTSKVLADDFRFLVESLGGTARIKEKKPHCQSGNPCKLAYIISVTLPNSVTPFRLSRKAKNHRPRTKYLPTRGIKSVEYAGRDKMICISVDAPDKCYVIDHCIVTHNTWATFLWPLLKVGYNRFGGMNPLKPVLLVVPEQLHDQGIEEAWRQFGIKIYRLDSQDTFLRWTAGGTVRLEPGWYITSYTQLCSNKVRQMPDVRGDETGSELTLLMNLLNVSKQEVENAKLKTQSGAAASFDQKARHICRQRYNEYAEGISMEKNGIRCVYSPSLAELCCREFECVVIDEGTRIKGDTTKIGTGVRLMQPKYRLVLTATPIKNRLPDLFWLAWWAAGGKEEAHARWPYSGIPTEKDKFGEEFLVGERNITAEKASNNGKALPSKQRGNKWRKGKVTAEVCNIHRLWKLIGPVVLRRRKRDIGEDIVKKVRKPVYVPMGKKQAKVYEYHLEAEYLDKNDDPALGAKLQALRSCAAAPHSPVLHYVEGSEKKGFRSDADYIPKVAAALEIIEKIVRSGEQVTVFSALHEPLDTLARKLDDAGVPYDLLDGRTDCSLRGALSLAFQKGRPKANPVMLAGANAMAEGNNWFRCSHAILIAFDWAYNIFEQAINRIHRLNSPKDVTVWPIICKGTIDRRLESLIDEKGDAAELVLDGALMEEATEEVSLRELLKCAHREFLATSTVEESELEKEWPLLRSRLSDAWAKSQFIGRLNGGIRPVPMGQLRLPHGFGLTIPVFRLGNPRAGKLVNGSTLFLE